MANIIVTDYDAAKEISNSVVVGKSFVFLSRDVFKSPRLSWLKKVFGAGTGRRSHVISLFGRDKIQLPGMELGPVSFAGLQLRSITCDKAIYQAARDPIHLLVLNPLQPNAVQAVVLKLNGAVYSQHRVSLGSNGEGHLILNDLPTGDFEVLFDNDGKCTCSFTVAEYKLVPLVASIVNKNLESDGNLKVGLKLESYGLLVSGDVRVTVVCEGETQQSFTVPVIEGLCSVKFVMSKSGQYSLMLQLASDPSRTANVPIIGSREAERSFTVFSPLGDEITGSLLPSEHANEVRGIYLEHGGTRTTPISLERVDAAKARLNINCKVESLRVVLIDPVNLTPAADAIDPATAPHPGTKDSNYSIAEQLFQQGSHAESLKRFIEAYNKQKGAKHPYYSYFIACCYAALDDLDKALDWLKKCIVEGWSEFDHMATDPDLAKLHKWEPFERLLNRGWREITFDECEPGQVVEVDVFKPYSVLLLGAYANGKPWEGWTSVVSPSVAAPHVVAPPVCEPGAEVEIKISTAEARTASVYAIVKDARLMSPDSPVNRLAACIKSQADLANAEFSVAYPTESVMDHLTAPGSGWGGAPIVGGWGGNTGSWAVPPAPMAPPHAGAAEGRSARSRASGNLFGRFPSERFSESDYEQSPATFPRLKSLSRIAPEELKLSESISRSTSQSAPASQPLPKALIREPEVVFAGFVPIVNGEGTLTLTIPEEFTDYVVECFQISGLDWSAADARFRVEKDPFLDLHVPVFSREGETAFGMVQVGCNSGKVAVRLTRNGADVELISDSSISAGAVSGMVSFKFLATPGEYEVTIENEKGVIERKTKQVNEPGKLRRRVKSLLLLEKGQSIALGNNPDVVSLAILPGLDKSFKDLAEATAEYGHACCEQTGAKILSNCFVYLTAESAAKRAKAEAGIIAGIRRERTMFIPGVGFKMYPEHANTPHAYYTPIVVRYLYLVSSLIAGGNSDLQDAVKSANDMAESVNNGIDLGFPAKKINTCEDAYHVMKFGKNGRSAEAADFVRSRTDQGAEEFFKRLSPNQYFGKSVYHRIEAAYAAACLLRTGDPQSLVRALEFAGGVIDSFNESGMLYSTTDSAAGLVLMCELQNAKVTGAGGEVEIHGRQCSVKEALDLAGKISSVKVLEGVVAVEQCKVVIEDWNSLSGDIQIRVGMEKAGRAQRSFASGDAIDLVVDIESGYKVGDLLWVCLPESLSRVVGGGQVKLFSVDFRGLNTLRVPLVVTGTTRIAGGQSGSQSFAVCVRNMFNEERGASSGLQQITVS